MKLKDAYSLERKSDQPGQRIKEQRHYSANKGSSSQDYGFSSGHVCRWELDCKESWEPKSWCFWTVVLEKTLASPLDCKEIQPVHPKGDQSWVFIGKTDAEAETPILWPPDVKSWLIGKDPDAGKDWRQEEKGMTEDEVVGWHHRLDGHGFGWTPGAGDGQGGLVCCDSWGRKKSDTTEWLNWTELNDTGRGHMKTEAPGVSQPRVKQRPEPLGEAGRGKEGVSPGAFRRIKVLPTPRFQGFWLPELGENTFSVILSHQNCGHFYDSPKKAIQ